MAVVVRTRGRAVLEVEALEPHASRELAVLDAKERLIVDVCYPGVFR